jgi:hypothetical protein
MADEHPDPLAAAILRLGSKLSTTASPDELDDVRDELHSAAEAYKRAHEKPELEQEPAYVIQCPWDELPAHSIKTGGYRYGRKQ